MQGWVLFTMFVSGLVPSPGPLMVWLRDIDNHIHLLKRGEGQGRSSILRRSLYQRSNTKIHPATRRNIPPIDNQRRGLDKAVVGDGDGTGEAEGNSKAIRVVAEGALSG